MKKIVLLTLVLMLLLSSLTAHACTVFGVTDDAAEGKGTILIKNRDEKSGPQYLKLVIPEQGNRFFGLFVKEIDGLRGGINEKGLVAGGLTASTIPAAERNKMPRAKEFYEKVLERFSSVDDVVKAATTGDELFIGPRFLMVADKYKLAYVEIGPEGKTAVKVQENGVLYHTNHYIDMAEYNKKDYPSSTTRYSRIAQLFEEVSGPYDLDNLLAFSNDRIDGPNNSIFRTVKGASHTVAVMGFKLPLDKSPEMYIRLVEEDKVITVPIDDVFSGKWSIPSNWLKQ